MAYNSSKNIILAVIYRPPLADNNSFHQCLQKLDNFISKHNTADIHLYGDYNMRFVDWNTKELNNSYSPPKTDKMCAHELIDFMDKHMLNQIVTENTRKDKSILDLIITNNIDAVHSVEIDKTQLSDHDIVKCNLLYKKMTKIPPETASSEDSPLDSVNLNKANWDSIRSDLSSINWVTSLENKDVEEMHKIIYDSIVTTCSANSPKHANK